jgi:threonine dehydrogenase-like Zn-dependent dehydrogenase
MQLWNWRGFDVVNAHERDPAVSVRGMREAVTAIESGMVNPQLLITHRYPLQQLGDALNATRDRPGNFVKAVVIP